MLSSADLEVLACPSCRGRLDYEGRLQNQHLFAGALICPGCKSRWCVDDALPRLYRPERVVGPDAVMRRVYDTLPRLHDPGVRFALPLWGGGTERQIREGYMPYLDLPRLQPRSDGKPLRILEVSIGTGANLPLLLRDLPRDLPIEIWGLDISAGMLGECRRKLRAKKYVSPDGSPVRLLMADAHALPFVDDAFDRVFHVGGISAFRQPGTAMSEMARVAKSGTPIVVVDEALDPEVPNNFYHRAMFRMLTALDADPHPPREHIPFNARVLCDRQVSRFYYCLAFEVPVAAE